MKFAHVETGEVLDPQFNDSAEDYLRRYDPEITKDWVVQEVPDNALHNATIDQGGEISNPEPVVIVVPDPPQTVTKSLTIAELQLLTEALPVLQKLTS